LGSFSQAYLDKLAGQKETQVTIDISLHGVFGVEHTGHVDAAEGQGDRIHNLAVPEQDQLRAAAA
jgi:hypothetical protein